MFAPPLMFKETAWKQECHTAQTVSNLNEHLESNLWYYRGFIMKAILLLHWLTFFEFPIILNVRKLYSFLEGSLFDIKSEHCSQLMLCTHYI